MIWPGRTCASWILIVLSLLLISACTDHDAPSAKRSWEQVLKSCGASDLQKTPPLYFGAANGNGVGSIWSVDAGTGDYWPTSQLSDITSRSDIVFSNTEFACSGEVKDGISFNVGGAAKPVIFPVSASIQNAFSKAVTAKVSVKSIVQEDAFWDRFNAEFSKLPNDDPIKQGVQLNNRLIVARAWKIRGFQATLTLKDSDAASVKAEFDAKVASGTVGITVQVVNDATLSISSSQDLYVAGVFRKLSAGGVAAASENAVGDLVAVPDDARVAPPT